jgi:hypothetical protein
LGGKKTAAGERQSKVFAFLKPAAPYLFAAWEETSADELLLSSIDEKRIK